MSVRRVIVVAAALVGLAWLGTTALLVRSAQREVDAGLDDLEGVWDEVAGDLEGLAVALADQTGEEGAVIVDQLRSAESHFAESHAELTNPVLYPWRAVPIVGRQIGASEMLTEAAVSMTGPTSDAFADVMAQLDVPQDDPSGRVAVAEEVNVTLASLRTDLAAVLVEDPPALWGGLADARARLVEEHDRVLEVLGSAIAAGDGLVDFLRGPTNYLLLGANNAEMRAGSGMFLQAGSLRVEDGEFSLSGQTATADLLLESPGTTLDPDVDANWGWLRPDQDWRNLNLTPRFPESGRMAADMWVAAGREAVDGVMAVDVIGLKALLGIVGPVEVEGVMVSADTVTHDLFFAQYAGPRSDTVERRERLGEVAGAVFAAFNDRPWSTAELLEAMSRLGPQRHVLAWSTEGVQQEAWEAVGADGHVPSDALMLSVLNRNGTKLDQFLTIAANLVVEEDDDHLTVGIEVTISNDAPGELPRYVGGPAPRSTTAAGEYEGFVELTYPGPATNMTLDGAEIGISGPDGESNMVASSLRLPRGERARLLYRFDLPEEQYWLRALASARVPATEWQLGDRTWRDGQPQVVVLDEE